MQADNKELGQAAADWRSACHKEQARADSEVQQKQALESALANLKAQNEAIKASMEQEAIIAQQASAELSELKQQLVATTDANCVANRNSLNAAFQGVRQRVMLCARALIKDFDPRIEVARLQARAHFPHPGDAQVAVEALLSAVLFQGFENESFDSNGGACFFSKAERCARFAELYTAFVENAAAPGPPAHSFVAYVTARADQLRACLLATFRLEPFTNQSDNVNRTWEAAAREVFALHLLAMAAPVIPRLVRRAPGDDFNQDFCEKPHACMPERGFTNTVAFMIYPGLCQMDEVVPGLLCKVYLAHPGPPEAAPMAADVTAEGLLTAAVVPEAPTETDAGPMAVDERPESPEARGAPIQP